MCKRLCAHTSVYTQGYPPVSTHTATRAHRNTRAQAHLGDSAMRPKGRPGLCAESRSILHKPPFINPRSPPLVARPPRDQWLQGRACCPAGEVLPSARPRLHRTPGAQAQLRGSGPAQGLRPSPGAQVHPRGSGPAQGLGPSPGARGRGVHMLRVRAAPGLRGGRGVTGQDSSSVPGGRLREPGSHGAPSDHGHSSVPTRSPWTS